MTVMNAIVALEMRFICFGFNLLRVTRLSRVEGLSRMTRLWRVELR